MARVVEVVDRVIEVERVAEQVHDERDGDEDVRNERVLRVRPAFAAGPTVRAASQDSAGIAMSSG